LGNIHLFADSYLAPHTALFAGGTSFVAKMGLLRIVSETGIIGGLLFLFFVFRLCSVALRDRRDFHFALLMISIFAYFLVSQASLFYIVAGATVGIISARRAPVPMTTIRFSMTWVCGYTSSATDQDVFIARAIVMTAWRGCSRLAMRFGEGAP
jgi:hypothetical protein